MWCYYTICNIFLKASYFLESNITPILRLTSLLPDGNTTTWVGVLMPRQTLYSIIRIQYFPVQISYTTVFISYIEERSISYEILVNP